MKLSRKRSGVSLAFLSESLTPREIIGGGLYSFTYPNRGGGGVMPSNAQRGTGKEDAYKLKLARSQAVAGAVGTPANSWKTPANFRRRSR